MKISMPPMTVTLLLIITFILFRWLLKYETYITVITQIDFLGHGFYIVAKNPEPLLFIFHLVHVDVNCWHIFIATSQSGVLEQGTIEF